MNRILLLFAIIAVVYCCAIGVDIMDVDSSQYAAISREMNESHSYLQVYEQGKDYLDKPPFLFWINSVSIAIFGENNLGFKFPSILFALLALLATYRFARLFYDEKIAILSAVVLGSCQALFLITNDVRTDTILMSWVIVAFWQLAQWFKTNHLKNFLWAMVAIGGGMLTKGPIALIVPMLAFGSHFVLQRNIRVFFKPEYLLGILVIGVVLLPMSLGLYWQYDLQPGKTVYGINNVSGLRFFYWTQSFGRITGESTWNNNVHFSFLFENLLWGFLPWTLYFISGLVHDLVGIVKKGFFLSGQEEFISTGGFILTYMALGNSKYQLPHYIYVVLPLIAITTAKMIYALYVEGKMAWLRKTIAPIQWLVCALVFSFPVLILTLAFPSPSVWPWMIPVIGSGIGIYLLWNKAVQPKIMALSLAGIISANVFLSLWFYPNILQYQAGSMAGKFVSQQNIPRNQFFMYHYTGNTSSLHFYSKRIVKKVSQLDRLQKGNYVITMQQALDTISLRGRRYELAYKGPNFHVAMLNGKFLNKRTRNAQCVPYCIIKLLN
jgi:4-amino-4-deoxy-L-arabinose transferase-like glycosyltransferase